MNNVTKNIFFTIVFFYREEIIAVIVFIKLSKRIYHVKTCVLTLSQFAEVIFLIKSIYSVHSSKN